MLKEKGYKVFTVYSADSAVKLIKKIIDLFFTYILKGKTRRIDVLEKAQKYLSDSSVGMMTE
jgi:hypothetical protein